MKKRSLLGKRLHNHIDRMVKTMKKVPAFRLILWNEPRASARPVVPATDGKPTRIPAAPVTKAQGQPEKTFTEAGLEKMKTQWEAEKQEKAARLKRGKDRYTIKKDGRK